MKHYYDSSLQQNYFNKLTMHQVGKCLTNKPKNSATGVKQYVCYLTPASLEMHRLTYYFTINRHCSAISFVQCNTMQKTRPQVNFLHRKWTTKPALEKVIHKAYKKRGLQLEKPKSLTEARKKKNTSVNEMISLLKVLRAWSGQF